MKKMIEQAGFQIVDMKDTHLRFHFMCRVPFKRISYSSCCIYSKKINTYIFYFYLPS